MNILLVGAKEDNSTDGVIVKGIKYLLNKAYPGCTMDYQEIDDYKPLQFVGFKIYYKLIVVCGTPWLWDSLQYSVKYKNLRTIFASHPQAKRLFMAIGACLNLDAQDTDICKRPDEVLGIQALFSDTAVIVRDHIASDILHNARIPHTLLPCPAFFCYGDQAMQNDKHYNVLIFQDPTKSISGADWTNPSKLEQYSEDILDWVDTYHPAVYVAKPEDIEMAEKIGLPTPMLLKTADETLNLMEGAKHVLSCRVHCAIPAESAGANVKLIALDTRSYTYTRYRHMPDKEYYINLYIKVLREAYE